jgi:nucleolar protein 6
VELTAGGGGNKSESRKEKLKVKNDRLTEERVSCMIILCINIY